MKKAYLSLLSAYVIWAVAVIFWKLFKGYSGFYILNVRIVWSAIFMLIFLGLRGDLKTFFGRLRQRRNLLIFSAAGVALYGNWLCNTIGPMIDQVLEMSMGQYLSPLLVIGLGSLIFREKLTKKQWLAAAFALAGLVVIIVSYGSLPWIIGLVSSTFFFLTIIFKGSSVPALEITAAQLLLMTPVAIGFCLYYDIQGQGFFSTVNLWQWLSPVAIACVSTVPLLFYNLSVKRLPAATLGFFQYLGPTCSMLMSVFVFHEEMSPAKLFALCLIWIGIFIYLSTQVHRSSKPDQPLAIQEE